MFPQFRLIPEKQSFAVTRKMCLIYGAIALCAVTLTGALISKAVGALVFCLAVCGFVLLDLIVGLTKNRQSKNSRVQSTVLCAGTVVAVVACIALFLQNI